MQEGLVFDLRHTAKRFILSELRSYDAYNRADEAVIKAINAADASQMDREDSVMSWLNRYRVLRYFPKDKSRSIADVIIKFADKRRQAATPLSQDLVISEFESLRGGIRRVAPHTRAGVPREVMSLTSKALWCCYPDCVPIYDDHARRALQVIGRLCGMTPSRNESEYACFADIWFQVYAEVEQVIDNADLD